MARHDLCGAPGKFKRVAWKVRSGCDSTDRKGQCMTRSDSYPTRRNLFGGIAMGMLLPQPVSAAEVSQKLQALTRIEPHSLLRGIAVLGQFGDPVIDEDAAALLGLIEGRMPEARLLVALYRKYQSGWLSDLQRDESEAVLILLHQAVADSCPVAFDYTDLAGSRTSRRVLPLALIHPPHGIQLLAWCELRSDYRKFFVGFMSGIAAYGDNFANRRLGLLAGLLERESQQG